MAGTTPKGLKGFLKKRKASLSPNSLKDCEKFETPEDITMEQRLEAKIENMGSSLDNMDKKINSRFDNLEKKVENLMTQQQVKEVQDKCKQIENFFTEINDFKTKLNNYEQENASLKTQLADLKQVKVGEEITELKRMIELEMNAIKQYQRRDNLRFFNVPERRNEDTTSLVLELLRNTIGMDMKRHDIAACHRIPIPPGVNRNIKSIIVRFVNRESKEYILSHWRTFKDKGITVVDDLTPKNSELFRNAKACDGLYNVTVRNGLIKAKRKSDNRFVTLDLFTDFTLFENTERENAMDVEERGAVDAARDPAPRLQRPVAGTGNQTAPPAHRPENGAGATGRVGVEP